MVNKYKMEVGLFMPKYCPKCGHSFPEDWNECNECEVELVYEEKDRELILSQEEKEYYDKKSRGYLNQEFVKRGETLTFEAYPYKQDKDQHIPKCPICGSTNLKKLSALDRGTSVFMLGLGSNKIGKTYQCKNCKSTF